MRKKPLSLLNKLPILLVLALVGCGGENVSSSSSSGEQYVEDTRDLTDIEFTTLSLAGTDDFGRTFSSASARKEDKEVGIFYFIWHGSEERGIYDVSELLKNNPAALNDVSSGTGQPAASPLGSFHYFAEPLFGYYDSRDPWVIARHCELFTMAGIDYLVFDTTNSFTYDSAVLAIIDTFSKFAAQGFKVPKLAFYTNSHSEQTVNNIYKAFYESGKYADSWYLMDGKPMLVTNKEEFLDKEALAFYEDYFTLKGAQWPDERMRDYNFPWMCWDFPQYNHGGIMSVSIAQMPTYNAADMEMGNYGRGHTWQLAGYGQNSDRYREGLNYEEQWKTAIEGTNGEVNNAFITGWNEWMAIKNRSSQGKIQMVDGFNLEYSRDAEMTKTEGGYGDNFYVQTVRNIRNFAYEEGKNYALASNEIAIGTDDTAWDGVRAYRDFEGDAMIRNYQNAAGDTNMPGYEVYYDDTARNDIVSTKITHDAKNLYVRVETAAEITAHEARDDSWMNLFIGVPENENVDDFADNWNFRINANPKDGQGLTSIDQYVSSTDEWFNVGNQIPYAVNGNVIEFAIPLSKLGIAEGTQPHVLLKATDHLSDPLDSDDFYISGDSAPIGRLSYEYGN